MFVHPATTHLPRTYASTQAGHPTTGRRKLAVHNENALGGNAGGAGGLPTKTPSRAAGGKNVQLVPNTAIRVGLGAKTEGRDRNVLIKQIGGGGGDDGKGGGDGGKGKGKGKDQDFEPKRLFASSSTLPPSKSLSNLPHITQGQAHKTPARPPPSSRKPQNTNTLRTPAPSTFKVAPDIPLATPLPSATRRRRSRSSGASLSHSGSGPVGLGLGGGTPARPTAYGDQYKTPLPSGQRWEEEHSLDSIDEIAAGEGIELDVLGEVVEEEEESDLEVEYMPPKVQELPFAPAWDNEVDVESITRRMQGVPVVFLGSGSPVLEPVPELEKGQIGVQLIAEEDLEDPIFRRRPLAPTTANIVPAVNVAGPRSTSGMAKSKVTAAPGKSTTTAARPNVGSRPAAAGTTGRTGTKPILKAGTASLAPTVRVRPAVSASTFVAPLARTAPKGSTIRQSGTLPTRPDNRAPVLVPSQTSVRGVEKEDEAMRLAREELGAEEMVFELNF